MGWNERSLTAEPNAKISITPTKATAAPQLRCFNQSVESVLNQPLKSPSTLNMLRR